jgi:hypothetical protein
VAADVALTRAQLALCGADIAACAADGEALCGDALRRAEALSGGAADARVALVLAVSADATMTRLAAAAAQAAGGMLANADGVYVAEALYRRALQLLAGGNANAQLTALLQRRLAEVLRLAGPTRAPEAERLIAGAAAHLGGVLASGRHAARPWAKGTQAERKALLSLRLRHVLHACEADT